MESSLPFHDIEALPTDEILLEVLRAPSTLVALSIIAVGIALWVWRDRLSKLTSYLAGIAEGARQGFGFEDINTAIVRGTNYLAEVMRASQTGHLNLNVLGILVGLIVLLASIAVVSILGV
jgi:hypothetical protein